MSEPVTGLKLLSAAEVGKLLDVPKSTVEHLARQGRLPSIVIGRRVRFDPQEIRETLSAAQAGSRKV